MQGGERINQLELILSELIRGNEIAEGKLSELVHSNEIAEGRLTALERLQYIAFPALAITSGGTLFAVLKLLNVF